MDKDKLLTYEMVFVGSMMLGPHASGLSFGVVKLAWNNCSFNSFSACSPTSRQIFRDKYTVKFEASVMDKLKSVKNSLEFLKTGQRGF